MTGSNGENIENKSTRELEFQEFVKKQFELIMAQMGNMEGSLRSEMNDRFLQLSRQIRELDQKVDVFVREHLHIKDDIREIRTKMNLQ